LKLKKEKEELKRTALGLTVKEQLFVDAYLGEARFNATEAARIAGYKGNDNTLGVVGFDNLRKPKIAAWVIERLNEAAMSANEVLARLSKQARGSLADVLTEEGEFDLASARARKVDDLLKKLKVKKSVRRERGSTNTVEDLSYEYEIHDAQAALVHLGKFHKLFADRVEHSNPDGSPIAQPIAEAMVKIYGAAATDPQ
jgi:phage terminase small subunit